MIDNTGNSIVTLKHHQAIKIYGLQKNSWEITEQATNEYTTEIQVSVGSGTPNNETRFVTGSITSYDGNADIVDVQVDYTNTRDIDDVTPTGVIMNVAPYVLMVVIAAAGCFVFLRKRRDD